MVAAQMLGGMGSAQEVMLVVLVAQNNCSGAFCSRCQNSAFAWSRFGSVMIPVRCNSRHGILPSNHLIGAERRRRAQSQACAFAFSREQIFDFTEFIGDSSKYLTLRGDSLRLDFTPIGVSPPSRFCRSRRTT
jgi:hypothetical protein